MSSAELQNLARIGKLKREPPSDEEISGRDDRLLAEIITTANELRRIVSSSS
jgi:hypothetical protein